MALPLYLAQTATEMAGNPVSGKMAYMACHFSPGGDGLSNFPKSLPTGSILILDDSIPMDGHNPQQILAQLQELVSRYSCDSLLLDFQRENIPGQQKLARVLCEAIPCPVVVSEIYARELSCPVFLPPVPPDRLPVDYFAPLQDREIWLEAALDGITLTLTDSGCEVKSLWDFPEDGLADQRLHCHYAVETTAHSAVFRLWRTGADLDALLTEAKALGVTGAVGLWQEL